MKYILSIIILLLFIPIMAQNQAENKSDDNPINIEEMREAPEPFEDTDQNEAENLETDEEEEPEALDIDDTEPLTDEFFFISETEGKKVVDLVKKFQGDDTLTGFIVEPSTFIDNKKEELFDVSLKKGSQMWTVLPRTGEVVVYLNMKGTEEREKAEEEGDKNFLFSKAIEFLNSNGISLVGYTINKDNMVWSRGCYEWIFENKANLNNEGFEGVWYIRVAVCPKDNEIYYFEKDVSPMLSVKEPTSVTSEEIMKIPLTFYSDKEKEEKRLISSASEPYYDEDFSKMVMAAFVISELDEKDYNALFIFDAYGKQLLDAKILGDFAFSQDVQNKIKEYKENTKDVIQPELVVKPYEPLREEDLKSLSSSKEELEAILQISPKKGPVKSVDIKQFKKIKDGKDIWTITKNNRNYIFREGSPWALENNSVKFMNSSFGVNKNQAQIPLEFAKSHNL